MRILQKLFLSTDHLYRAVPAHLLSWIIKTTAKLEIITNKGLMDGESCQPLQHRELICMDTIIAGQASEAAELASHIALSLSLLQGTVLNHEPSKIYLGRKPALEVRICDFVRVAFLKFPADSVGSSPCIASPINPSRVRRI